MRDDTRAASLWMVGASISFATMAVFIKLASDRGVPLGQLLFGRGAISLIAAWIWLRALGVRAATPHWQKHLYRALIGFASMVGYVYAISHLPVATATTLNYTSPLWLALILTLWHKETTRGALVAVTVIGFAGVALLMQPTFNPSQWFASLIGLSTGIAAALGALNVRAIGNLNEPPVRTVFYFALFVTIGSLPWMAFDRRATFDQMGWSFLLIAGLLATLGQWLFTHAFQGPNTQKTSVIGYAQVLVTSLAGVVVWGDHIAPLAWAGMALIVVSGIAATLLLTPRATVDAERF